MGKREELGMAAGKGAVSGVTKWAVGLLLAALVGGGAWAGVRAADDDHDDGPTSSQTDDD